jgi:hypothetical protein
MNMEIWWGANMTQLVGSYDKGMKHRDGFNHFRQYNLVQFESA